MDSFFKTLRWYISALSFIAGCAFIDMAVDRDSIRPVGMVVVFFAFVFWFSKSTYESAKNIFVIGTVIILFCCSLLYLNDNYLFFIDLDINFFYQWGALATIIGFPAMWYTFAKYDG